MNPYRIDPEDCGCTDCISGYSEPLNVFSKTKQAEQARRIYKGKATNATGRKVVKTYSFGDWE